MRIVDRISVNGEIVDLDEMTDFYSWIPTASPDEVIAVLARVAALTARAGFSDEQVEFAVNEIALQIAALRDKRMVN